MGKQQHRKQQRNKAKEIKLKKANKKEKKAAANRERIPLKSKNAEAKKVERSWQK